MAQDLNNDLANQSTSVMTSSQEAVSEKTNGVACACQHPVLSFTMYSLVGISLLVTALAFTFPQAVAPMAELLPDRVFGNGNRQPKVGAHCCDSAECACHAPENVKAAETTDHQN